MANLVLTESEDIIKYIIADMDKYSYNEVHVVKYYSKYYITIAGKFEYKYLDRLKEYFEIISFKSSEENCITIELQRLED